MFNQIRIDPENINKPFELKFKPDVFWVKNLERGNHFLLTSASNYHNVLNFDTQRPYSENDEGILHNEHNPVSKESLFVSFSKAEGFFDWYLYSGDSGRNRNIKHNLKKEPSLLMVKNTSEESDWVVWHKTMRDQGFMRLNSDEPFEENKNMFAHSVQNNKTIVLGQTLEVNKEGCDYITLAFADGKQFQSGVYKGVQGENRIETKHPIDLIVIKRKDAAGTWRVFSRLFGEGDSLRLNSHGPLLKEDDRLLVKWEDRGFTIPVNSPALNQPGGEYIWFGFTEK